MDNQGQSHTDTSGQPHSGSTPTGSSSELSAEFQELGKRLAHTVDAALNSQQRHEMEREIRDGLKTLSQEAETAFGKARTTKVGQDVEQTVTKTVDNVRTSKVTAEVRDGVVKGLRELNNQLARLAASLERHEAPHSSTAASPAPHDPEEGGRSPS